MRGVTTNQLMIFHAIVEEGSIRAAARQLNMAPPSVSLALKALELGMGLPLLMRTTRRMELTEAGQQLYQRTRPILDSLSSALETVRDLREIPSGTVRLTLPRFVAEFFLKPIYGDFCALYPEIQLEISVSDAKVNLLAEGFDAGIRFGDGIEEGMVARALTPPMQEALFASPDYQARHGLPTDLDALTRHRLIQYRFITANQLAPLALMREGERVRVDMPTALVVNDTDMMVDAARKGLGIGRMVLPVVYPALSRGELLPVLPACWPTIPGLHLFYPQHSQKARRIRVLIDFLIAHGVASWPSLAESHQPG